MLGNQVIKKGLEIVVEKRGNRREKARIAVKRKPCRITWISEIIAFQQNRRAPQHVRSVEHGFIVRPGRLGQNVRKRRGCMGTCQKML